ncbi:MAG: CBS domain-containing protein, partial [Clostridiales Family XIII bacterium]|nr:CBS domain-containing protein [Clostridiales Family XIII bacterium]
MREKTSSLPTQGLLVKQMMDRNIDFLRPTDPIRKAVDYYNSSRNNILPVVDKDNRLVGGFPRKRLLRALVDGVSLDIPCKMYMVQNPITINENLEYDEVSLVFRVEKSRVDSVIVLDDKGIVCGTIGMGEYLKASLNVILTSSATLEAMFCVNHEGIIIVDDRDCIIRINPMAERMFGLKAANVQGQVLSKVLPEIIGLASSVGKIGQKQNEIPPVDNSTGRRTVKSLPVLVTAVPIIDKSRQIGLSYAFLDVSEVERIANELAIVKNMQLTINGIINASSDGVIVSGMDGTV